MQLSASVNGSSLKRKQPDQLDHGATGAEGTPLANLQSGGLQELRRSPGPPPHTQHAKKQKAPALEEEAQDAQQSGGLQQQCQGQQEVPQQQAPQAGGRQHRVNGTPPPGPELGQEWAGGSGRRTEKPLHPQAVSEPQQPQRAQQHQHQHGHQQHPQQQKGPILAQAAGGAERQVPAAPITALHPGPAAAAAGAPPAVEPRLPPAPASNSWAQQQPGRQRHNMPPPRRPLQQQGPPGPRPDQVLPAPPPHAKQWQQPLAGWWPSPQQPWDQQQQQPQQQQLPQPQQQPLPVWNTVLGPAWEPMVQPWTAAPTAAGASQHAQHVQQQQWGGSAAVPLSHPGLGWQALTVAPQQQQAQGIPQQAKGQQGQPQANAQGQHGSKLQRDVPPGGPAEALLRLAVRICCQRLGMGEHDGKQLGKVLEELDRNWRVSMCGGHSVTVLLKELDRRGLVVAREDRSGGKRICYFRNLAC